MDDVTDMYNKIQRCIESNCQCLSSDAYKALIDAKDVVKVLRKHNKGYEPSDQELVYMKFLRVGTLEVCDGRISIEKYVLSNWSILPTIAKPFVRCLFSFYDVGCLRINRYSKDNHTLSDFIRYYIEREGYRFYQDFKWYYKCSKKSRRFDTVKKIYNFITQYSSDCDIAHIIVDDIGYHIDLDKTIQSPNIIYYKAVTKYGNLTGKEHVVTPDDELYTEMSAELSRIFGENWRKWMLSADAHIDNLCLHKHIFGSEIIDIIPFRDDDDMFIGIIVTDEYYIDILYQY